MADSTLKLSKKMIEVPIESAESIQDGLFAQKRLPDLISNFPINKQTNTNFSVAEINATRMLIMTILGQGEAHSCISTIITENKRGDRVALLGIQITTEDGMHFQPLAELIDIGIDPDTRYRPLASFTRVNTLINGYTFDQMEELRDKSVQQGTEFHENSNVTKVEDEEE